MKTERKYDRLEHVISNAPAIKTLDIKLSIADRDLEAEVRQAFDLAKSSGRELTVCFSGVNCSPQGA